MMHFRTTGATFTSTIIGWHLYFAANYLQNTEKKKILRNIYYFALAISSYVKFLIGHNVLSAEKIVQKYIPLDAEA